MGIIKMLKKDKKSDRQIERPTDSKKIDRLKGGQTRETMEK